MEIKWYLLLAVLGIVCLSPSVYGSSTYYYRTQLIAEANDSAAGKVYASTSASAPGDAAYGTRIESDIKESSASGWSAPTVSVTFNVWAKSNEGYTFKGWSETKTATSGQVVSSWTVNNSSGNKTKGSEPLVQKTIYAIFEPAPQATITFVANEGGTYTVNGGAPASNPTNIYQDVTLSLAAQPDAQHGVLGWYFDDGTTKTYFSSGSVATYTIIKSGTIGVEFCASDEVSTVTTYEALTAALADSGIKKVLVPSGSTVVVPEGSSMTIPSGKSLSAEGTLYVDGSVTVQGLISGNVSECTKLIRQQGQSDGVPFNPYGTEKYWKTSVTTKSGTISGATAHATVVNGLGQAFRIALPASSKLLVVTRDTSVAVNHITGISSVATSGNIVNATASGKMSVLLETGCVVNGGLTAKTGFAGVVDCAGINCSTVSGVEVSGNNGAATFLNCPNFTVSKCVNISHSYYNCQSVKFSSYNGGGAGYVDFYDCGPTVSMSYTSGPSTSTYARFYSGTYDSIPQVSSRVIYGGRYKQDPGTEGAYLATGKSLQVKQEGGYYVVYEHIAVNVAQIDTGAEVLSFETLQDAFDAVGSGQTVRLVQNYGEGETVTVAADKNFSFELAGYSLTNTAGRIINNGVVWIKDSVTMDATAETSVIGWGIENNGVITNTYGTYKGNFTLNAGSKWVTHNGRFLNQLVLGNGAPDPASVADLRGGYFSMALKAAGFLAQDYLQKDSWVGKFPYALVEETTQSGCEKAWQVTALPPADLSLYAKSGAVRSLPRTEYANDADWCRRAELESMLQPYSGTLDCTVSFDRAVSQGTVTIYANAKTTINESLDRNMAANEVYRLLITKFLSYGSSYTLFGYDRFLTGNDFTQTAKVGTADIDSANTGTVIKYELEVCHSTDRHADPQTPSLFVKDFAVATCRYMLGGKKAVIDREGGRFAYDSLAAAVAASQDGETILIGADTAADVTLAKAGTYTIDPYGFKYTGQVSIDDGFFLKTPVTTSTSLAVAQDVPSADASTYVVARKVAQVDETFYDNLNQAIAAADGAVVTLLAATDETVELAKDASFTLAVAQDVAFDESKIHPPADCVIKKEQVSGGTKYTAVLADYVAQIGETEYASIEDAVQAFNAITTPGDYTLEIIKSGTYALNGLVINQDKTNKKSFLVTAADGIDVTLTSGSTASPKTIFMISGQSSLTGDPVTFKDITFDLAGNAYAVYAMSGTEDRYAHDLTVEGCTFVNSSGAARQGYVFGAPSGANPRHLTMTNCTAVNINQIGSGYFNSDGTKPGIQVVDVTLQDCKAILNNQSGGAWSSLSRVTVTAASNPLLIQIGAASSSPSRLDVIDSYLETVATSDNDKNKVGIITARFQDCTINVKNTTFVHSNCTTLTDVWAMDRVNGSAGSYGASANNASVRVTVNNLDSGASVVLDGKTASDIYCKDAGNIEGYGEGVNVDDILLAYVAQVGDVFFTNFADAIAAAMSTVPPATIVVIGDPSGMTAPEGWTFLTDAASGVVTLANLPTAVVTRLSDAEVESDGPYHVVELTDDVDHPEYVCDLKPAFCYTFESVGGETPLDDWYVDYTISFNRDVARNSMGLTGNYNIPEGSPFFMAGDVNLGFFAKDAVAAGVKIPLLNYLTTLSNWTYRQIRENVGTFKCGAFNLSANNVGTEMTVELRLFAPTMTPEDIRDSSTWVEGVNTFVVASVTETFTADNVLMIPAAVPPKEWPMLACTGTASAESAIPAGSYYLSNAAFVRAARPMAVSVPTAYFGMPCAVTKLSDAEVESDGPYHVVELTDDVDHPEYVCDLKPAFCYTFESVGGETPLDDWYVDYTISFNRDVARNSMGLTGNYNIPEGSPFFMAGDVNLGFFAKDAVAAGVKIPLLNYLTTLSNWTYRQIRENVGTFKCGAFNLSANNVGTEMTVELRLFAPTMTPEDIRDSSTWVEGVNTFVVASVTETFTADTVLAVPAAVPPQEWPTLWYAGTANAGSAIPAGVYHLSDAAFVQTEEPVAVSVPTAYFNVPLKLEPGQSFGTVSKEEAEAVLAAAGGNNIIAVPAAVAMAVTDQGAYKSMFEGVVVQRGGNWFVAVVMTDAIFNDVQAAVNQAANDIPLTVVATNDTEVIVAAKKGLYYSVLFTTDLRSEWTEDSRVMATDGNMPDDKMLLALPHIGPRGFYRIVVNMRAQN